MLSCQALWPPLVVKHINYFMASATLITLLVAIDVPHITAHMTHSKKKTRALHVSVNEEWQQQDSLIWLLPGGRARWQGSGPTSPATDCRQAQAPTRAARARSSGRGATVIARGCGQRTTTPAASSRKMSQDF